MLQRYRQVLSQLQLRALAPFPVQHVGRAYGIRVEGEAGWKLIFSGDTRPCQSVGVSLSVWDRARRVEIWLFGDRVHSLRSQCLHHRGTGLAALGDSAWGLTCSTTMA